MPERIERRRLIAALLEAFENMGLQVTHVVGSTKYENPNWFNWVIHGPCLT